MDEPVAALKLLAMPDREGDPKVLWYDGCNPFVGNCAKHAARDPEWATRRMIKFWNDEDDEMRVAGVVQETNFSLGYRSDKSDWSGRWYCVGCGRTVRNHG